MAIIKLNNNSISAVTALPSAIDTGSLVLLETTTVTSVSSITIGASTIDDTYEHYQIVISDVKPVTDGAHGRMRFTIGGTEQSGSSDYSRVDFRMYAGSASGGFYVNDGNASYVDMVMGESIGNDTNFGNNVIINIFKPSSSHHTYGFSHLIGNDLSADIQHRFTGFKLHKTGEIDGVNLFWSSGNFSAQGKIKLYGVK